MGPGRSRVVDQDHVDGQAFLTSNGGQPWHDQGIL